MHVVRFAVSLSLPYHTMTAATNHNSDDKNLYNTEAYLKPDVAPDRPFNEVDYRSRGGPKLTYLWPHDDEALVGQTLYLGGEVGSDGKIYFIPGHASRVLQLDPDTDALQQVGPVLKGKYKYLRGLPVGDIIYGLPCHADSVLRINTATGAITTLDIPYESFFAHHDDPDAAAQQRAQEWKYHGGNQSPVDGCIYAIPQSATHVLKIDPATDKCTLVGPSLPGRWKWYGGVIGKQDGAIYGKLCSSHNFVRRTKRTAANKPLMLVLQEFHMMQSTCYGFTLPRELPCTGIIHWVVTSGMEPLQPLTEQS